MSDHEWCRDVRRDEQVRAAEDAAAVPSIQHRDLPEQVALLWASVGDLIGRVVRLEGEFDAGQDEEAAPAVCDSASPAEGLRTERVTPPWQLAKWDEALAIICDGGDWGRGNNFDHGVLGALVIWADKEMDRLTAERDAALRERDAEKKKCEMLREDAVSADIDIDALRSQRDAARCDAEKLKARVAELERAYSAECDARAQAHRELSDLAAAVRERESGEECDHSYAAQCREAAAARERADRMISAPPPRGWLTKEDCEALYLANAVLHGVFVGSWREKHDAAKRLEAIRVRALSGAGEEAAPPPRGWLTAEERDLIAGLTDDDVFTEEGQNIAKAILARETPPRVRKPNVILGALPDVGPVWESACKAWIAAIRAAGGEVE